MLFTRAKMASMAVPTMRKGIDSSQRIGQRINTSTASGQQRANRIAQRISVSSVFMFVIRRGCVYVVSACIPGLTNDILHTS